MKIDFKERYNKHNSTFNSDKDSKSRDATTLSTYVGDLKDNGINHTISWKIIDKSAPYSPSSNKCNLCLLEKYYIICKPHMCTLNKRNELAATCRHRRKHLLCNG